MDKHATTARLSRLSSTFSLLSQEATRDMVTARGLGNELEAQTRLGEAQAFLVAAKAVLSVVDEVKAS